MDAILASIKSCALQVCCKSGSIKEVKSCLPYETSQCYSNHGYLMKRKTGSRGHIAFPYDIAVMETKSSGADIEKNCMLVEKAAIDNNKNLVYVTLAKELSISQILLCTLISTNPFAPTVKIEKTSNLIALLETCNCDDNLQYMHMLFAFKRLCARFDRDCKIGAYSLFDTGTKCHIANLADSGALQLHIRQTDAGASNSKTWFEAPLDFSLFLEKLKLCPYDSSNNFSNAHGKRVLADLSAFMEYKKYTWCEKESKAIEIIDDRGEVSSILYTAAAVHAGLNCACSSWISESSQLLVLASANRLRHVQSSVLLLEMLFQGQSFDLVHRYCTYDAHHCCREEAYASFIDQLELRRQAIQHSYVLKYGDQHDRKDWSHISNVVALASLKLECSCGVMASNSTILEDGVNDISASRSSLYILYNYSRLNKILKTYDEKVCQGVYKPLPPLESVDFSFLKNSSEWELCLRYILFYPAVLQEVYKQVFHGDSLKHKPLLMRRLFQFLLSMCREFSSYYHQTKVLLDPQPHLFPVMCARLCLIMAVKKVMDDCFEILDVRAPSLM